MRTSSAPFICSKAATASYQDNGLRRVARNSADLLILQQAAMRLGADLRADQLAPLRCRAGRHPCGLRSGAAVHDAALADSALPTGA